MPQTYYFKNRKCSKCKQFKPFKKGSIKTGPTNRYKWICADCTKAEKSKEASILELGGIPKTKFY